MGRMATALLFISGVTLASLLSCGQTVFSADYSANPSKTTIKAGTQAGDITMTIDSQIDFGTKPLATTIDFGSRNATLVVHDYTSFTNGYTIHAKAKTADLNRSLKINAKDITDTAFTTILKRNTDVVGENAPETLPVALKYTNVTEVKTFSFIVDWTLTKGWLQP